MADKQMTSFEDKLKELDSLTQKLESGELSIDEAIEVYSHGLKLAIACKKNLDEMSQKVTLARESAMKVLDSSDESALDDDNSDGQLPF